MLVAKRDDESFWGIVWTAGSLTDALQERLYHVFGG